MLLARLVRALRARRGAALAATVLLTALLALIGSGLGLDEDLLAFLPSDDPKIAEHARAFRGFKALDMMRIDLGLDPGGSRDAATPAELDRLARAATVFEHELSVSPLISRVFAGVSDARGAEIALTFLDLAGRSLPSLLPAEEIAPVLSRYESDASLDERLQGHFELLNSMEGQGAQTVVLRDPLGLEGAFWKRVEELRSVAPGARMEKGHIVSADGHHALFLVEPAIPASKTEESEKVLALVADAARAANVAAPGSGSFQAVIAGGHRASIENARTIKRDSWLTSLVSLACMLVVYAAVFPRRWLIPLTALPLAFGGVFGFAACRLLLGRVSAIAVGFGGILLGLADDFIVHLYYFYEVRARDGHPEPAVSAVERVTGPTLYAGASIAAAFVALAASGFPGQRDLAVFATTSLLGTVAFCLVVQPLLLPSTFAPRDLPRSGAPLRALVRFVERHEKAVLALVVLATLALGWAATGIRFEDDPRAIDARSAATRADEDTLGTRWGDPGSMALVVARGGTLAEALDEDDRVYEALVRLRDQGRLEGVSSIAPLLPGPKAQEERRRAWRAFFSSEVRARLQERLVRLGHAHGFAARAFERFFARTEQDGEPVDADALLLGPLGDIVKPRLVRDAKGWLVVTFAKLKGPGDENLAWAPALEKETGALVTTGHTFAKALVSLIRTRLAWCGALAFAVVLAILVPALRRPRAVLAAALPLGLGLVWSVGIFALTGTTINAVNFLIPVLTFGLSVDYVLFLASGYLRTSAPSADEIDQAEGAVVASSTTTLAGMASLLLARHPALWSVGVVALVGTASSLLAIFLVTPCLLRRRTPA